jgi:hypothetical protein
MKEFEKSLINKLKEKMNTIAIKEQLLSNIRRTPPGHFEHIKEEIQSLSDKRINELIKKVEDMLQDINMYETGTETWQQEFKKLGDYSENEKKFMEYFCKKYIWYMGMQLESNNSSLNYSMLNGIKESLKNSGHHSNIEEQLIDKLINIVKIKYLGSSTKWIDSLDIPEIEKRFAKSVRKFIEKKNSKNTNLSNSELQEILKKNSRYSNIEKSRMTKLISNAKKEVNNEILMYN